MFIKPAYFNEVKFRLRGNLVSKSDVEKTLEKVLTVISRFPNLCELLQQQPKCFLGVRM